jgi:hypothetical protein
VAEIGLDGARVVAVVGELEPAGMPQHVGMYELCAESFYSTKTLTAIPTKRVELDRIFASTL